MKKRIFKKQGQTAITLFRIKDIISNGFEQYSEKASDIGITEDYMAIWGDYSIGTIELLEGDDDIFYLNTLAGTSVTMSKHTTDNFILVEDFEDGKIVLYNEVLKLVSELRKSKFQKIIDILF